MPPLLFVNANLNEPEAIVWTWTSALILAAPTIVDVVKTLDEVTVTSACRASSAKVPPNVNVWEIEFTLLVTAPELDATSDEDAVFVATIPPVVVNTPARVALAALKVSAVVVPDLIIKFPLVFVALPKVVPPSLKNTSPPSASSIISAEPSMVKSPVDVIPVVVNVPIFIFFLFVLTYFTLSDT